MNTAMSRQVKAVVLIAMMAVAEVREVQIFREFFPGILNRKSYAHMEIVVV